jgi:predicted unusual protein kinase regulating ubiquinone biosynthesis (AarF/ABC1/UbiB family)
MIMKTIREHLDDLDRMVDCGLAPKHEIRSQIAFIASLVAALEADYVHLNEAYVKLQNVQQQPHATVVERGISERGRQVRHL